MNTELCVECGLVPELLDEDLTCGPCRIRIHLGVPVPEPMKPWTVAALHDEDSQELLIAGIFPGHHSEESSSFYATHNLYRFTRLVEAPTADDAEAVAEKQFAAALAEMSREADEVAA
ncbi:hypothetical protein [Streptomyces sp. CC210A]|uniref:hypothetical protein n=1 Tax=Streptomyces sp. CC210A TaxID=2898184 RepID=UPI001F18EC8F|nr:hypothetical protein [Streptomyces sp. CC210A]